MIDDSLSSASSNLKDPSGWDSRRFFFSWQERLPAREADLPLLEFGEASYKSNHFHDVSQRCHFDIFASWWFQTFLFSPLLGEMI